MSSLSRQSIPGLKSPNRLNVLMQGRAAAEHISPVLMRAAPGSVIHAGEYKESASCLNNVLTLQVVGDHNEPNVKDTRRKNFRHSHLTAAQARLARRAASLRWRPTPQNCTA